jgi:hypothetical protein
MSKVDTRSAVAFEKNYLSNSQFDGCYYKMILADKCQLNNDKA